MCKDETRHRTPAGRWIMSWRATVPKLLPDEHISWKCPAQRREPGGIWQSAGELYVTEHRLIWQPPRWALAAHRATVSDHHTPDATAPF